MNPYDDVALEDNVLFHYEPPFSIGQNANPKLGDLMSHQYELNYSRLIVPKSMVNTKTNLSRSCDLNIDDI